MAPAKPAIEEHDVVRFCEPIANWPAGTSGTVVDPYADAMLVEISDEWGCALDFVTAPIELLEVTHPQGRPRAA